MQKIIDIGDSSYKMISNKLKLLFAVVVPIVMTCGTVNAQSTLYSQSVVTTAGGGQGGADLSGFILGSTAGHGVTLGNRLALDFSLTTNASVSSIIFQAYQTNSSAITSPFSGISAKIWSARPGDAGASVLFSSTTRGSNSFANLFRAPTATSSLVNRPVFDVEATFTGANLSAGTYWLDVELTTTNNQSAFAPGTTGVIGERSLRFNGSGWVETENTNNGTVLGPAEFGFKVKGTADPSANVAPEPAALSLFILGLPVVLMSVRKVNRSKAH